MDSYEDPHDPNGRQETSEPLESANREDEELLLDAIMSTTHGRRCRQPGWCLNPRVRWRPWALKVKRQR